MAILRSPSRAEILRADNEDMREAIADLRQSLEDVAARNRAGWVEREREYEAMLEARSEEIRMLYLRLQQLEDNRKTVLAKESAAASDDVECSEIAAQLVREQCQMKEDREQVDVDREQLRVEEDAMRRRMREMELVMAKSRSDMARQRNEIDRLHDTIRNEIEQAKQNKAINQRLQELQSTHPALKNLQGR